MKQIPDIFFWIGPLVVSNAVVDDLRDSGVNGWEAKDVEIELPGKIIVEQHKLLCVTGKCLGFDLSKCHKTFTASYPMFPGRLYATYFGLDQAINGWDGSDLFCAPKYVTTFGTSKVADVLRKYSDRLVCQEFPNVVIPDFEIESWVQSGGVPPADWLGKLDLNDPRAYKPIEITEDTPKRL